MQRVLPFLLVTLTLFSACRKDDDPVFDQSPDERINQTLEAYQTALAGSTYGWNAVLTTANGVSYHFHFSFNDANRVQMFADIDTVSAIERKESSFRLKALQQPALLFDTYSYIHILADPDGSVNGGEYGTGLRSDFEFSLDTLTTDSIRLTGRFNGSSMVLSRATQEDLQNWSGGEWKKAMLFEYTGQYILNYFRRLVTGGRQYEIMVNPVSRTVTFTWMDGNGVVQQHTTAYYFTSEGVVLESPLTDGATTVSSIADIVWDANAGVFRVDVNGVTAATIQGAIAPVRVDLDAPQRWWQRMQAVDGYWVSLNGFHVDGVDDAFGLRKLPDFYFLLFWPGYGANYDLAGYVFLEGGGLALNFGTGFNSPPLFTANGRIIFNYLGDLGDIPDEMLDEYVNTAIKFIDADGFYLVQTSATSYDMVSAKDARTWITWTE